MTKREALRALRTALLALYDNPTSIRRLVDDAGVDAGLINFQGSAQDIFGIVSSPKQNAKREFWHW